MSSAGSYLEFLEKQFTQEIVPEQDHLQWRPEFSAPEIAANPPDPRRFIVAQALIRPRSRLSGAFGVSRRDIAVAVEVLSGSREPFSTARRAKRVLDVVLGSLALFLCSPVILGAAAAVALSSPGGAFYRQTRVGLAGQTFTMWKMRTMYVDAPQNLAALADGVDPRSGLLFKMRSDPRITPVGRVLRRFSIDELPQLLNLLRGEMSLVGPRPPLLAEVERYSDYYQGRLLTKPGITGLWQVSGRAELSWEDAVRLDARYMENWSISMDLMILWKTFRAVWDGEPGPSSP
ncbi:sugar transferase [Cellulomonas sp. NPDC055163]